MNQSSSSCDCKSCTCGPQATFFGSLGNESRLAIVMALKDKEQSVNELSEKLSVEQSALSHALKQLHGAGVVHVRREGKFRLYSLNEALMGPLLAIIEPHVNARREALARPCCESHD